MTDAAPRPTSDPAAPSPDDPTIGKLVIDASRDIEALVKGHIELAKAELKVTARTSILAIILFLAAAYVGTIAFVILSFTVVYFIHWDGDGLALHWAFLIVLGAWLLLAGLLGLVGFKRFQKVKNHPTPERSIAQGKQLPQALKGKA